MIRDPDRLEIGFTTVKPDCCPVRDKDTGLIAMPLVVRDERGAPVGETESVLDGIGAESMYAYLDRTPSAVDAPRGAR
ncbi:hypothetical protein [Embleya scabrispora]|uniref:hypothetical protein n=1 Tax=Embleya scabrispora TaxID=159449 RepID=UPI000370211E|nr:hypothetical protein [Embleya scabrispora]MYS82000.1 hypothetical protein [Streptomyces sp. SID5474]